MFHELACVLAGFPGLKVGERDSCLIAPWQGREDGEREEAFAARLQAETGCLVADRQNGRIVDLNRVEEWRAHQAPNSSAAFCDFSAIIARFCQAWVQCHRGGKST
jgi:hypothetical protein